MGVAVNTLADRVRRSIRDSPAKDTLLNGVDTPDTLISVTNPLAGYQVGKTIIVDRESMLVTAGDNGSGQFGVTRGWENTTVATHTAGTPILIGARFNPSDILDALNEGMRAGAPYFFKRVVDTTLTTTSDLQSDYTLPAAFGTRGVVTSMDMLFPGLANDGWRRYRWFHHLEGAGGRQISLIRIPPVGTALRLIGVGPFSDDLAFGGTTDAQMLDSAITAMVMYARYTLKLTDEAGRDNTATAKNIGPGAVTAGANLNLAMAYQKMWQEFCLANAQRWPQWQTRRRV